MHTASMNLTVMNLKSIFLEFEEAESGQPAKMPGPPSSVLRSWVSLLQVNLFKARIVMCEQAGATNCASRVRLRLADQFIK